MIWKTAWKNVWRNRVRSLVVIASVIMGVFAAVFSVAFMNGMIAQRVDSALDQEISHIQITGPGFRLDNDPRITIPDIKETERIIESAGGIAGMAERTVVSGMASTATKSAGIQIVGVDPEKEKMILSLYRTIIPGTGDFFGSETRYDIAIIGQDLAKELNIIRYSVDTSMLSRLKARDVPEVTIEKLKAIVGVRFPNEKKFNKTVEGLLTKGEIKKYSQEISIEAWSFRPGSRMNLTFLDINNNQVEARFRIAGIYDLKNTMFEMSNVFVRDSVLKRLAGFDDKIFHQVVVRIDNIDSTEVITGNLRSNLPGMEIVNWKELQPDLAMMTDYVHQIYGIFMAIIMAALAFGIVNTMLMAVLERTKELGMLAAIGMNRRRVFSMIMLESVFLSITGGIGGMIVGWAVILLTARNGINFLQYAEGMEALGYSAHVFPQISAAFFIMMAVMVVLTGILSSVYPAMKALKLNPVEAIRTE